MGTLWPKEFWEWARENGLHPRGPRGSPINKLREKQIPRLHSMWLFRQKEK